MTKFLFTYIIKTVQSARHPSAKCGDGRSDKYKKGTVFMKSFRRAIALLLSLLMIALPLIACGESGEDAASGQITSTSGKNDRDDPANDPDAPKIPADLDCEGAQIKFIVANGDEMSRDPQGKDLPQRSITVDPDVDDMKYNVNKEVRDRNIRVEEELGVEIVLARNVDMGGLADVMKGVFASDSYEFDVVAGYQYYDLGLAIGDNTGYFLNYKTIDSSEMYIDPSKPYWDEGLYNALSYNGAAYWITGDLSQTWVGSVYVTFVNKNLWELYADKIAKVAGTSDIYEIIENGKWTLDLLCDLSSLAWTDTNANDKVDVEDNVGFLSYKPSIVNTAADGLTGGAHLTFTDTQNGKPQVAFNTSRNAEFASKLYRLYFESNACLVEYSSESYYLNTWAEGRSLFTVNVLSQTEMYLNDMTDDYYVVPCPKLNEEQKEYSAITHDNVTVFGIPRAVEQEDHVAATTATLELMAYYSKKLVTPAYYDTALKERYSRDEKTGEMIDMIRNSLYYDFVMLWSQRINGVTHFFRENIGKRFASESSSKEKAWETSLKKLLNDIANSAYT